MSLPRGSGRNRPGELRLFDILMDAGIGVDVPITTLYEKLAKQKKIVTDTRQQQYVGSFVSRYNSRGTEGQPFYKIVPGELKRTYRITRSI